MKVLKTIMKTFGSQDVEEEAEAEVKIDDPENAEHVLAENTKD